MATNNKGKGKGKKEKQVSPQAKAFVLAYLDTMNATAAYMQTHPGSSRESAWRNAHRMMRNDGVRELLSRLMEDKYMGASETLATLADQARGTLAHFVEVDDDGHVYFDFSSGEAKAYIHLIKKIKTKRTRQTVGSGEKAETWEHEWVEVELWDKQAALQMIGRHFKLFTDRFEQVNTITVENFEKMLDWAYASKK